MELLKDVLKHTGLTLLIAWFCLSLVIGLGSHVVSLKNVSCITAHTPEGTQIESSPTNHWFGRHCHYYPPSGADYEGNISTLPDLAFIFFLVILANTLPWIPIGVYVLARKHIRNKKVIAEV